MEIHLIRHTSPLIEKGVCYGQSDILLAPSFEEECGKLKMHLPVSVDVVYSSPLMRCQRLAQALNTKGERISDKRLMELNFGTWELKKWDDIPFSELDAWMKDFVNVPAPGGENFAMLYARASNFFEEIKKLHCKHVAVVTHAGVIRAVLANVLEMPLKNAFKIPVAYASVTRLKLDKANDYCAIDCLSRT